MNRTMRVAVLAVLTLLLLEAGVRTIESALPELNPWHEPLVAAKVRRMDALSRTGGTDIVFAGSSQMLFAGDPAMLKSLNVPWSAYNASLWGAPPIVSEHWLTQVVLPRLHPKTVLLGVSPIDFIESPGDAAQTYFNSPAVRDDWLGWIERSIADRSAVVRHRRALRSPKDVVDAVMRRLRDEPGPPLRDRGVDLAGRLPCCDGLTFSPEVAGIATRELFAAVARDGWTISETQRRSFQRMVSTLKAQGAEVILIDMAISAPMIDLLGKSDYAAFRSFLRRETESLDIPLLDLAGGVSRTAFFFDYNHVNRAGANVFNTVLARALRTEAPGHFKIKIDPVASTPLAPAVASDVLQREADLAAARTKAPTPPTPDGTGPVIPTPSVPAQTPKLPVPPVGTPPVPSVGP